MRLAALPDKIRDKELRPSRSAINWRVRLSINHGMFIKNFYGRSERAAETKALVWLGDHYDEGGYRIGVDDG